VRDGCVLEAKPAFLCACRQPSGKRAPGSKGSASSHTPNVAAAPAYTYVLQGAGLLVQQAVSNVAGCCLHTAPHVAVTSSAAVSLTGYLSNLDEVVERLALSDGIALGSYGAGSDQGSVAAEALLQIFLKSTFNPLVALSELQATICPCSSSS